MYKGVIHLISLLVSVVLVSPAVPAQSTYGTIAGTISDSNGAVISGAKVEITNLEVSDFTASQAGA